MGVHFVGEHVFAWAAHGVVGRDLDHYLVQVLDDVFELLCRRGLAGDCKRGGEPLERGGVRSIASWSTLGTGAIVADEVRGCDGGGRVMRCDGREKGS